MKVSLTQSHIMLMESNGDLKFIQEEMGLLKILISVCFCKCRKLTVMKINISIKSNW
jgi:hypothetical protein